MADIVALAISTLGIGIGVGMEIERHLEFRRRVARILSDMRHIEASIGAPETE